MCENRVSLKTLIANRYGQECVNKIKHLEFLRTKRVRIQTSLAFFLKCRDSNVLPTGVRIAPRKDIPNSEGILRETSVRLLRQLIRNCRYELSCVQCELYKLHLECSEVLSNSDFDLCDRVSYNQACRLEYFRKNKHETKYDKLLRRQVTKPDQLEQSSFKRDAVINLSDTNLDTPTHSILAKGLNYALTPKRIPYENVISSVEETIMRNKVPAAEADTLRQDVAIILRKSKLPRPNITTEERQALQALRENPNILVLKADKGNATVVMNSEDYDVKIRGLLNDTSVYKPVSYNPLARTNKRIRALVSDHRSIFTDDVYERLHRPKNVQPPKIYGLPKVHKQNAPLRPIVSQIDSPTYDLAKHIATVLQPLIGKTQSFVKDSRHFVDIIKGLTVEPDELMVSFDVESLFTNVPIYECLTIIEQKLLANNLSSQYIVLLKHCLEGNFFLYQGQYYLQIDGVAMGSPVAPVLANIWMEHFEEVIQKEVATVKLWKRYVDDIFCIMKGDKEEVERFITYLNSVHPKVQFTFEIETERSLAFLDLKVTVRANGTLAHTAYRKPTHTDRYLHGDSHHHPQHLRSVAASLQSRAYDLCDPEYLETELAHIQKVLKWNGYHENFPYTCRKRVKYPEVSRAPAYLPYVKGVTDKVGNALRKLSIKTIYVPQSLVSRHLRTPKDVIPFQTPGVYKVDCSCGSSYIGQTKRTVAERIKEHIAAVKNRQVNKSAIAEHLLESGPNHWIELHKPTILSTDRHYYSRIAREAIEIKKHTSFNREDGYRLSSSWNPVFSECHLRNKKPIRSCVDVVSVVCRNTDNLQNATNCEEQARVGMETRASRRRR